MHKYLLVFLLISTSVFGKGLTFQKFQKMKESQRIEVIKAYKEFFRKLPQQELAEHTARFNFSLLEHAYAAGDYDCFYAGWPSSKKQVSVGGKTKSLCSSPGHSNAIYKSLSSSCGSGQLLCQPALFGNDLCVSTATQALRNSAYNQCEKKFEESGRTLKDVVRTPAPVADEMLELSSRICKEGFQSNTTMCRNLEKRIQEITDSTPASEDLTAGVILPEKPVQEVLNDAVKAIIKIPEVVQTPQDPNCVEEDFSTPSAKVICPPEKVIYTTRTLEELKPILEKENIKLVTENANPENVERFLREYEKFPVALRQKMVEKGIRIHLMEGEGVTVDPGWDSDIANESPEDKAEYEKRVEGLNRDWSKIPGAGGSTTTPTRIVINHLYDRHGSANLFLHEHAHTLDSLTSKRGISDSEAWKSLSKDPKFKKIVKNVCGAYCEVDEEAFAEMFAYFNSCAAAQKQVEKDVPALAAFLRELNGEKEAEIPKVEPPKVEVVPEPDQELIPFERVTSGLGSYACRSNVSREGYSEILVRNCNENEKFPGGVTFVQKASHPLIGTYNPFKAMTSPYRSVEFVSQRKSLNETYLTLAEISGAPDSYDVKSVMILLPRKTVPKIETIGDRIHVTLPTGEKVVIDKDTKAILDGALLEGPMDLNEDRFKRKQPNVHYIGTGISIRVNHRYLAPMEGAETATIKQGKNTCTVPRAVLFADGEIKSQSDAEFVKAINTACKGMSFNL